MPLVAVEDRGGLARHRAIGGDPELEVVWKQASSMAYKHPPLRRDVEVGWDQDSASQIVQHG